MSNDRLTFKERRELVFDSSRDAAIASGARHGWSYDKIDEAKEELEMTLALGGFAELLVLGFMVVKTVKGVRRIKKKFKKR